jgi:hypothetical protein
MTVVLDRGLGRRASQAGRPTPSLTAIHPLAVYLAPARPRLDRNRPVHRHPHRLDLPGQLEHPGAELFGILDMVPRAIAQDG